jgi:hypothetical protein
MLKRVAREFGSGRPIAGAENPKKGLLQNIPNQSVSCARYLSRIRNVPVLLPDLRRTQNDALLRHTTAPSLRDAPISLFWSNPGLPAGINLPAQHQSGHPRCSSAQRPQALDERVRFHRGIRE